MSFDQLSFWIFLCVAWTLWRTLPFAHAKTAAVGASLLFYGWWNPAYIALILVSATADFVIAQRLEGDAPERTRRLLVTLSVVLNLGLLAVFKYTPFVSRAWANLLGDGLGPDAFASWVVPVGISFYTFQTLSYSIDVYRRRIPATRSYRDFLLYVSFFPQLVAGPIVRAREFLPQLETRRRLRWVRFESGVHRCVQGLFLKVVVADNLAPAVGRIFEGGGDLGPGAAWAGAVFFGAQIFADFAGYTGIAIGVAQLLGLRFPENFHAPYIARGLSDFWARWHVTLSTWLRDYLYIPLGGNRGSGARTAVNLMLTMLLGGLWHGAAWTFVVWGALHGAGLWVERLLRGKRRVRAASRDRADPPAGALDLGGRLLAMALTFAFVHVTWVFFRAQDFDSAWRVVQGMLVSPFAGGNWAVADWRYGVFLAPIAIMHLARLTVEWTGRPIPGTLRAVSTGAMAFALLVVERAEAPEFLYFQF